MALGNVAIAMASQANEPGWESLRLRHGLFSYSMAVALTGTEVARVDGQVPLGAWLRAGVTRTLAEASRDGTTQTPRQLIGWAGDPRMPQPVSGPRQAKLRERDALHQVTDDLDSLAVYALTPATIKATRKLIGGGRMNALQLRAINEGGALAGRNVVVAAPTSAGKTLIAYLAALAAVARRGRAIVLVPMRALASEKWQEFSDAFEACGVTAIRSFGGVDDDDPSLRTNHYDVAFLTYEKFLMLALSRPYMLDAVETIVLDEVHLIGDRHRGKTVELLLTLTRRRASQGKKAQLVCLSASLDETNGFEEWLDAKLIQEDNSTRPVPLLEGVISPSGRHRFLDSKTGKEGASQLFSPIPQRKSNEWADAARLRVAAETAVTLLASDSLERILSFPWSKPRTRALAATIGERTSLPPSSTALSGLGSEGSGRDDSTTTSELLARVAEGVGFHTADLDQTERSAIEAAFREGDLQVVIATSGLAMGINTPATSVVVVDHTRYTGREERIAVADYKNMVGRAGRFVADNRPGRSFLCAADEREADALFNEYVLANPEPLQSQLASLSEADLTLALLALSGPTKEGELIATAGQTFDGFQHVKDAAWRKARRDAIRKSLKKLQTDGYANIEPDGSIALTATGRVLGRSSLSAGSSTAVVAAARRIVGAGEALDSTSLFALAQLAGELEDIWVPANPSGAGKWEEVVRSKFLVKRRTTGDVLLHADPETSARRLKRMYCAARWALGTPIKQIEAEANGVVADEKEVGAGAVRQLASRIASIVAPLAKVLGLSLPEHAVAVRQAAVSIHARLELGVSADVAPLARMRLGIRRGEFGRLLELERAEFAKLLDGLERSDAATVAVFGQKRALRILDKMRSVAESADRRLKQDAADQLRLFDDVAAIDVI